MMVAEDMSVAMRQQLAPLNDRGDATSGEYMDAMGFAISRYIKNNAVVEFVWTATTPPPASVPDPITQIRGKILFLSFNLITAPSRELWLRQLAALIVAQSIIVPYQYNPPVMFSIPVKLVPPVIDPGIILNDSSFAGIETPEDASIVMCNAIIDYVKTLVTPVPIPGIRGQYTVGVANMIRIY